MSAVSIKYLEKIVDSGLFRHINKSEWIDSLDKLEVTAKDYQKGDFICRMGDVINTICIVGSGNVHAEKNYPNGDIHIVSVYEEGSMLVLEVIMSRLKTCPVDLVANENCQVIMITRNSIESSPYRDRMMNALTEMMADENIRQIHKIEILAERGLRDRVLVYLNILTVKSGSNTVTVKMSREQLAQYLCVNRSALSNELSKMKREGLIDFHKDQFTLLKPGAMFVSKEGLGDIPDKLKNAKI